MRIRNGPATVNARPSTPPVGGRARVRNCAPATGQRLCSNGRGLPREERRSVALPVFGRRRPGRPATGPAAQRGAPRRRRRAGPRREGHREVDDRAGAGRRAAAVDVVAGCRFSCDPAAPDPDCPDGPHPGGSARRRVAQTARPGWSSCRSARPRTGVIGSLDLERALAEGEAALRAGAARRRPPRPALRRRGQPAPRPPRRPAARRGGDGSRARRARRRLGAPRGPVPAGRHDEPGGGRAAPAAARPVRAAPSRSPRSRGVAERAEVVRRRLALRGRPGGLRRARARPTSDALASGSPRRERLLPSVDLPDAVLRADRHGLRGVRRRRACAPTWSSPAPRSRIAAWQGRAVVNADDVRDAARLALPHRRRRDPFDPPGLDPSSLDDALDAGARARTGRPGPRDRTRADPDPDGPDDGSRPPTASRRRLGPVAGSGPRQRRIRRRGPRAGQVATPHPTRPPRPAEPTQPTRRPGDRRARPGTPAGRATAARPRRRRSRRRSGERRRARRSTCAADAASRARRRTRPPAARSRRRAGSRPWPRPGRHRLRPPTCARSVREGREGNLVLFVVDASRVDGGPASGCAPSRPPCCRCCSTPTSGATRSG